MTDHPLAQARHRLGLRPTELALLVGCDSQAISGQEGGYKPVSRKVLAFLESRGVNRQRFLADCAAWQVARRDALAQRIGGKELAIAV
jgi:hypothetical protein